MTKSEERKIRSRFQLVFANFTGNQRIVVNDYIALMMEKTIQIQNGIREDEVSK